MLLKIKSSLSSFRTNFRGRKLNRKYVIFESDDWGSIRTPSKNAVSFYKKNNFDIDNSIYVNDRIESSLDIERLCDVLNTFKDSNDNYPIFTLNTILANPHFEKILDSHFLDYYYEPFWETYKRQDDTANSFELISQGIYNKLFIPQFHGREHLNINRWLKKLQDGDSNTITSFNINSTFSGKNDYSYMEAFDWDNSEDILSHKQIISDGLNLFSQAFGCNSISFIPPCYCLDPRLFNFLFESGIFILQGGRTLLVPPQSLGRYKKHIHYFGQKDISGLFFNVRNVSFEPCLHSNSDVVDECLKQINLAFLFNKPAVISSHRINYISSISEKNGNEGLNKLKLLLKNILKNWPDCEFISTSDLLKLL